ncbi:hypothetical protein SCHPADRAFT_945807 [Schizopora paradoxa]|uniref:DUF6533 domain-containing protein n=1 Tax=Schizopora paradoxa TaxID=27342 RepID=A0A0H2RPM2_9AGAM|nr:hypothetical protein SCHPADRAFT_945807 [Schizopora paradoxa]
MSELHLDQLVAGVKKLQDFRYTYVAAASLASYEYFINLDNEVRFLWIRRFSFGRVLLFLCRYLPLVQAFEGVYMYTSASRKGLDSSVCRGLFNTGTSVLYVRAYAVWSCPKKLAVFLLVVYITGLAATLFMVSLTLRSIRLLPYRIGDTCIFSVKDKAAKFALIKSVFDDSLALGLLLIKAIQQARLIGNYRRGGATASLLTIMARDGVLYFFLNLAITIANMCLFGIIPLTTLEGVLQNILCARLLFSIQIANEASLLHMQAPSDATIDTVEMERISAELPEVVSDPRFAETRSRP